MPEDGYEQGNLGRRDEGDPSWTRVGFHVIRELERMGRNVDDLKEYLERKLRDMDENLEQIRSRVDRLEVKSGVWGFLGGGLVCLLGIGVYMLKEMLK